MDAKAPSIEPTNEFLRFFLKYHILKTNVFTVIVICLLISTIMLGFGIAVITRSSSLINIRIPINQQCLLNTCTFLFHIDSPPKGPLYFFIEFDDFFVNNYKAISSFDSSQLIGNTSVNYSVASSCSGYETMADARRFYPDLDPTINGQQTLSPCGLYPLLYSTCAFSR